jgi:hypothetical protein
LDPEQFVGVAECTRPLAAHGQHAEKAVECAECRRGAGVWMEEVWVRARGVSVCVRGGLAEE